ncbi:cytosolic sulfotransferase 13-like [Phoenix dactylifera]|uniref:Sulfotransferase n=1 Tax=Phoenix dactylifera TaxID=42345 RepID=A0A8B7MRV8_PHODC|nr:cytosolic sulfotransferase 13-like [Phoenix dactylifera]
MATIPSKVQQEKEENPIPSPPQKYNDLISALPLCTSLPHLSLRQYQGFWFPDNWLPSIMTMQNHFKARPTDLILASYPKSGTTWLKALAFAVTTRTRYPLADHPLLSLNPHDCVLCVDELFADGHASKAEALPSPRLLATHTPYSVLPDSVTSAESECQIIYVCREAKDVAISGWHFGQNIPWLHVEEQHLLAENLKLFCQGLGPFGPIWDHILEYWRESQRRPNKVLFLKYEEMMEKPVENVKRLAEFVGCPFSEGEEREKVVEEIVQLCSLEKLKNLEVNKTGTLASTNIPNASFFRKGEVGDWRNHLDPEMARSVDEVCEQKLRGSGLTLGTIKD